ncbi:MAG: N-acetylmuramidase domain-containing protein [Bacteroidia bacterium]|jgi:hypothetical protein
MNRITPQEITSLGQRIGLSYAQMMAFIMTESPGRGFDPDNGKLLIQFEPVWFKRKEPFAPSGKWSINKVEVQSKEWLAFNNAYGIDPVSAMESTSIGLPQILGLHWKRLSYRSVGEMWDEFKRGEFNQVWGLTEFIKTGPKLHTAIKSNDWHVVATLYNGPLYKQKAIQWGREPYNITLEKNFIRYSI